MVAQVFQYGRLPLFKNMATLRSCQNFAKIETVKTLKRYENIYF